MSGGVIHVVSLGMRSFFKSKYVFAQRTNPKLTYIVSDNLKEIFPRPI